MNLELDLTLYVSRKYGRQAKNDRVNQILLKIGILKFIKFNIVEKKSSPFLITPKECIFLRVFLIL